MRALLQLVNALRREGPQRVHRPSVFNAVPYLIPILQPNVPNFGRLVLVSIDADFCNQILILQHFSRSTRFTDLCTASNSTNSDFTNIWKTCVEFRDHHVCKLLTFAEICKKSVIFAENFTEFCQNCGKS